MDMPDYTKLIEAEDRAWKLLRELADEMADECQMLWKYGDGYGGSVLDVVREAFHKQGAERETFGGGGGGRPRIPNKVKKLVFERDAYRCVKCESYKDLCIDHIYPYSLGGSGEPDNLQTLCWTCNSKKGAKIEVAA